MSSKFLSIYAAYHFLAAYEMHVHILTNFYVFRNLGDIDFALNCMDVLAMNAPKFNA